MNSFNDTSPIYRQIADRIKQDILHGSLGEEEQVMSTNQYASFFRINPATAAKAFQHLVDEGLLYKKRGIGMFVAGGAQELLRNQHRERFFEDVLRPMVEESRALGISMDEIVAALQRLQLKEGHK